MAKKRMISLQIVDSDDFLEMPLSAQALYLHLLFRADDEGFTNGVKKIMRMIGCREDDLKILIVKRFVLTFNSGVVVIKHWLIHNNIRTDRIIPTVHIEEKGQLILNEVNGYTEVDKQLSDKSQHSLSIGLGLDIGLDIEDTKDIVVKTPTLPYQQIITYLNQKINKSFKANSKKYQSMVNARFKDGFTLEDFYKVIDIKYNQWFKTDMAQYLRPSTLFGTKFDEYLNQVEPNNKKAIDFSTL